MVRESYGSPLGNDNTTMQIILFTKAGASARVLEFSRRWPLFAGLMLGLLIASGIFHAGQIHGRRAVEPDLAAIAAQTRALEEAREREVADVRREVEDHLGLLSLRVGELQAQAVRLDALGERLTGIAELDPAEFDFGGSPARGGPVSDQGEATGMAPPDLKLAIDELFTMLDDREQKLTVLEEFMLDRSLARQMMPSGRPVRDGWLSSGYGRRNDPFTGKREHHDGVDFAGRAGSEIVAVAKGVVTVSGKKSGYGYLIEIDHGNGYVTRYGHNKKNLVRSGDLVEKGQVIAQMGNSGRSTGPHVHFEIVFEGKTVNPMRFIRAAG